MDYASVSLRPSPLPIHEIRLLTNIPLIVASDGAGGVFVSSIQTVADSSNSSCLSTDPEVMSSFFALDPPIPSQCSNQTASWNTTRYQEPPRIRAFIPGGQTVELDHLTTNATTSESWVVNIREGTQVVLFVEQFNQAQEDFSSRLSPLLTVAANSNSHSDSCLSIIEFRSTVTLSSTTPTPTAIITASLSESTKNLK